MELIIAPMIMENLTERQSPIQSSNTAHSGRKILVLCIRFWNNTTHFLCSSTADWGTRSTTTQKKSPCTCFGTNWLTLRPIFLNTSSLRTSRQTFSGICATRAFFTAQSTKKASYRPNSSKMPSWWTLRTKYSIALFSMRTTLYARRCRTWTFKYFTRILSECKHQLAVAAVTEQTKVHLVHNWLAYLRSRSSRTQRN